MKLLYVEDQLVDLYATTVIAQTLQVYDPGRIGSIVTNYTASIKAPHTRNNELIFGFLTTKTKSDIPYSSLSCRYFENGLPIIRNARIVINEVNEQEYSFTIYSGPWGFFERIQLLTLWDLDFSDINGPWSQVARDGYRNTITGIVQALVDDGRLVQDQESSAPTIENQGSTLKPPQIYYHTVLEKIFDGFQFQGDIFTNDVYKKLVIPLSVIYNDPSFLESKQFLAASPGDQIITNPLTAADVIFDQNVKQGADNFYDGLSKYIIANSDTPDRYFRIQFFTKLSIDVTGGTVDIKIEATGYSPTALINKGTGTYDLSFLSSLGHADTDEIKVTIVKNTGTPTVEVLNGLFYSQTLSGIEGFEFFPTIVEEYVYFQKLFERITMLDFLKEFCVRFNCQITQINNILHVNTLNRILDIRTGPDWTTKREKIPNRIKYLFSSYGRTNYIKTPVDTDFTPDFTDNYGDGSFPIPNDNLKESATLYSSLFYVSEMVTTFGVFMLKLNLEPNVANFARMPGKRMFFVREPYATDPPCLYDAIDRSDYLVGYYFDPSQEYTVGFQFFMDTFHQKYIDRCLRKLKLVEREYNLSDLDIYAFNQQEPILDDGERFLVIKIINRVSKKRCKVELLKIESNPAHTFQAGGTNNITGSIEDTIEHVGNNVPPELAVELELDENVTGNPTWEATFDNSEDPVLLSVTGNGATDTDISDHTTDQDVQCDVEKTFNDGNGPDGFPVDIGWVEFLRNGTQVNTVTFDSGSHSSLQGLSFNYLDVKAWEELKVIVHEDGSTP